MGEAEEFAVIGDLMVECILHDPPLASTHICDAGELVIGGPALNVAWHLTHLGRRPKLIGCAGDRDRALVQAVEDAGVDVSKVVFQQGASDLLVTMTTDGSHRSVYIRADVTSETFEEMLDACRNAECIVLNGSRHAGLQQGFARLAASSTAFVAFNPSYAVYTYEREELEAVVEASDLTILNHRETGFVCKQFGVRDACELSRRFGDGCIVMTGEDRGAIVYRNGSLTGVPSISRIPGNVLGTGDAFLAGLLADRRSGTVPEESGLFAAALASIVARTGELRPVVTEDAVRESMEGS
jgi:sugar/nucleoside kinase (ribokinase family)